eukprot:2918119-Pyramimonas_sp.AAC.1
MIGLLECPLSCHPQPFIPACVGYVTSRRLPKKNAAAQHVASGRGFLSLRAVQVRSTCNPVVVGPSGNLLGAFCRPLWDSWGPLGGLFWASWSLSGGFLG